MKKVNFIFLLFFLNTWCTVSLAQNKNGFDLSAALIPADQVHRGGPAKDGIPALDKPTFVLADKVNYLQNDAPVIGINYLGISKAYPINILNWHEIVNDQFKEEPVVITFCPLCGTGMAFSALINGKAHSFGVSGLLYNSDVLLYDRQTQSLWSQMMAQAISGLHKGKYLKSIPVQHTTWLDWKTRNPQTLVLSKETGFGRNYSNSPYKTYLTNAQLMFPVSSSSRRYHPKEEVFGIDVKGQYKVYPFVELEKSPNEFLDTVNGKRITIQYNNEHRSATAFDEQGNLLTGVRTFWFAWYAFHPETEVYEAP